MGLKRLVNAISCRWYDLPFTPDDPIIIAPHHIELSQFALPEAPRAKRPTPSRGRNAQVAASSRKS